MSKSKIDRLVHPVRAGGSEEGSYLGLWYNSTLGLRAIRKKMKVVIRKKMKVGGIIRSGHACFDFLLQ